MNVHDLTAGQHAIAVYESPAEQAHLLAAFVRAGLERRERVLYFSYRDSPAQVAALLNRRGINADQAVADGHLVLATADTTYLRGGAFDAKATKAAWFDAIAHTVASGFDVMRVAADMNWAASEVPGSGDLPEYESAIAEVFATGHVIGLCEFDRKAFPASDIDELTRLHPVEIHSHLLFQAAGLDVTMGADASVEIAGDVDVYSRKEFEAALDAAAGAFDGDVRLDLYGLRFIDVGGMSALLRCTRRLKPQSKLILRGMRPHIRRAFALLKWDRLDRVRFE